MQSDTASLGSYLRQERERRRVALHDISAATKIQMRFLEALEADQHDQLPPLPFAVGFIRAYAQHLGLEPDAIVAEYRAMHRVPEEPEPRVMQLQPPVRPPKRWRAAVIGMLVIAIGLLTGRLWYEPTPDRHVVKVDVPFTSASPASRQEDVASQPAVSVPPPAPTPGTPARATQTPAPSAHAPVATVPGAPVTGGPAAVGPAATRLGGPAVATVVAPSSTTMLSSTAETLKPLVLQAQALQATWLRVKIDGTAQNNDVLLASGKSISWEAAERFVLTVGNANGVRVSLNGQEIALPPSRSNVVRDFLLTRQLLN